MDEVIELNGDSIRVAHDNMEQIRSRLSDLSLR